MHDSTRELLLKLRKNATSSWGPKQYQEAFSAIDFTVEIGKTGRSITSVTFTNLLGGATLCIKKEPGYRIITFYKLPTWLKENGVDVVERASKALGMDTPDVEKKLKDLYVRDLTNTGTCPVCEGNFKMNDGSKLVHHGFTRPGDGFIHGDCFGVGRLPWELSPSAAEEYVVQILRPSLNDATAYLTRLQNKHGEITSFTRHEKKGYGSNATYTTVEITPESDPYEFESMLRSARYSTEQRIVWITNDIARFEARIAAWKPDDLPEVKHAGKFKVT